MSLNNKKIILIHIFSATMLLACSGQNTGFSSNVTASSSYGSAIISTNPSIFLTTQGAKIPKRVTFMPSISLFTGYTAFYSVPPLNNAKSPAATFTVFPQRIELSGICNTGGAAANEIRYIVKNTNANPVTSDIYLHSYSSPSDPAGYVHPYHCDNGRFSIIVTPPNDPNPPTTNPYACLVLYCNLPAPTYYINVQLYTGPDKNTLTLSTEFETTFSIEL